jgi:hypothetical protein
MQCLQMTRNIRLVSGKSIDNASYGLLPKVEYLQDAQPLQLAKHSEAARYEFHHLVIERKC